jgi:hypothetical protein
MSTPFRIALPALPCEELILCQYPALPRYSEPIPFCGDLFFKFITFLVSEAQRRIYS